MISTKYKNIIIFGASQGIGKALALEYSSLNTNLSLFSRNTDAIMGLAEDINNLGGNAIFKKCDVAVQKDVNEALNFSVEKLKTIDLVIINAGVGYPIWMSNLSSSEIKKVFDINVFGIAHVLEYTIPIMKKQKYGTIAGVTSLADGRGYPGSASYCSSKAAASILLESCRVELKQNNINILTIKPGFVKTAMTDKNEFFMPCLMNPDKAARIIRKGIEKQKTIVQFPFFTVNLTRLVKNIPNLLYDPLINIGRKIPKN